jgi:hypothetical protein
MGEEGSPTANSGYDGGNGHRSSGWTSVMIEGSLSTTRAGIVVTLVEEGESSEG